MSAQNYLCIYFWVRVKKSSLHCIPTRVLKSSETHKSILSLTNVKCFLGKTARILYVQVLRVKIMSWPVVIPGYKCRKVWWWWRWWKLLTTFLISFIGLLAFLLLPRAAAPSRSSAVKILTFKLCCSTRLRCSGGVWMLVNVDVSDKV